MREIALAISIVLVAGAAGAAAIPAVEVHASCSDALALDAATRAAHVGTVRSVLVTAFRAEPAHGPHYAVDASLVELGASTADGVVAIRAEVHVVLTDERGRIQWFGSSGATVEVPAATFRPERVPALQREAVANATEELVRPVRTHMLEAAGRRDQPAS